MKFRDKHRLTLLKTDGPMQSTTTTFTFGL
jgi:hypothetical protein